MYTKKKSFYSSALYLRLSREDGDKAESDSIQNQRELIKQFVSKHQEIKCTQEFIDDGYSGTNFERPGFIRMMKEIENHTIDCVIVKDLSRLGRNYIETGKYLERVFPSMQVRFIAINDGIDSIEEERDTNQIIVPFKNLINDAYCRDISIKIRSQLDVKRKCGKFIGSFAGYGYQKDPMDKNNLIPDEPAANIVRLIFNMRIDGYSDSVIAQHLNQMGVLPPMAYKQACGIRFNGGYHIGPDSVWHPATVRRILKNELYTGTAVQGKQRKINYKVKKIVPVEEKEWIRVPNAYEPIIPKDIFDSVQKLLLLDTRIAPKHDRVDELSGVVRCADCGQNMIRRSAEKNGKKYYYYHCSTYKNGLGCSSHLISAERLQELVLHEIQGQISMISSAEAIIQAADGLAKEQFQIRFLNQQLCSLQAEIERYSELNAKLYQDLKEQVVGNDEYQELHNRFLRKITNAKKAADEISEQKKRLDIVGTYQNNWQNAFMKYQNVQNLERKMVISLLDRVVVYDKNRVEICFRFQDEMQILLAAASSCQSQAEERTAG